MTSSAQGVEVIILGCTELPILFPEPKVRASNGAVVTLVDPTDILARRCVAHAQAWSKR